MPAVGRREWRGGPAAAARRLESAWLALEEAAEREQRHWQAEVTRVRDVAPAGVAALAHHRVVLGAAGYLGLLVGGYLPVPAALRGFADWWWARL